MRENSVLEEQHLTPVNSTNDRETPSYTALDYIDTIASMLKHYDVPAPLQAVDPGIPWETSSFITHVVYLEGGKVDVDVQAIEARGIKAIGVPVSVHGEVTKVPKFNTDAVEWAMGQVAARL